MYVERHQHIPVPMVQRLFSSHISGLKGGKTNLNNLFNICHFNNLKLYLYDLS
jgi:hypothetical protein